MAPLNELKGDVSIDLNFLRSWIGKETLGEDVLSSRHARLMAATLGLPQEPLTDGAELPPLWHWLYFLEAMPARDLGYDGHAARGRFLPPVPLPSRMWAGGLLAFHAPLTLGAHVRKRSTITSVEHKQGRHGDLVFVTVRHEILDNGKAAIIEDHDIVYKQPTPSRPVLPGPAPAAAHSELIDVDSTMLFRYSALTFNGHRIHYDQNYCRNVEGYSNLVVHGPLQATLLASLACRLEARPLRRFRYRGMRPSLLGTPLSINACAATEGMTLWTAQPDGAVCMQAEAMF